MSTVEAELLINEVAKRPVLWDNTLEDYKDKCVKNSAWYQLCSNLISDFHTNEKPKQKQIILEIRSKWRAIRDNFVRSLRKQAECLKSPSPFKKVRTYVYEEQLSFLKRCTKVRITESGLGDNSENVTSPSTKRVITGTDNRNDALIEKDDGIVVCALATTTVNPEPTNKRKLDEAVDDTVSNSIDANKPKSNEIQHDEDIAFFYSLLPTIKSLNKAQKWEFRLQSMQLLQNIQNPSPTYPSTANHQNVAPPTAQSIQTDPFENDSLYPSTKRSPPSDSESRSLPLSVSSHEAQPNYTFYDYDYKSP
ncbi:hypothetical protein FQA39_LY16031 [Lamprigera yunnana]|nr:hypothetical protein FQA39_LY16031 [Lamprigera yunnana]